VDFAYVKSALLCFAQDWALLAATAGIFCVLLREVLEFVHRLIRVLAYNGNETWSECGG
jgi:hypothetical protein